jgi:predicted nucleic acid-binding protein
VDANVLIDYAEADRSVLALLGHHAGPVYVVSTVLEKVAHLSLGECDRLGLIVVEPTVKQLIEAGDGRPGLAFDDTLCLALARDNGWCCVTNDRALRKACGGEAVEVRWGLEVMLDLVELAVLAVEDAHVTARRIRDSNPAFITEEIVNEFEQKAREVGKRAQRPGGE